MVNEIKKHMNDESDKIDLFRFEDGSIHAWIPKKNILESLTKAMDVFVKCEEYEYAQKTDTLIKQYHINKLLSEV